MVENIRETIGSAKRKYDVERQNSADRETTGEPAIVNQLTVIKEELKAERKKQESLRRRLMPYKQREGPC